MKIKAMQYSCPNANERYAHILSSINRNLGLIHPELSEVLGIDVKDLNSIVYLSDTFGGFPTLMELDTLGYSKIIGAPESTYRWIKTLKVEETEVDVKINHPTFEAFSIFGRCLSKEEIKQLEDLGFNLEENIEGVGFYLEEVEDNYIKIINDKGNRVASLMLDLENIMRMMYKGQLQLEVK